MKKSIAILTWGLRGGSLANYTTALVWGFYRAGVKDIRLIYVADGIGLHINLPDEIKLVPLGSNRARVMPIALARYLQKQCPDYLISVSSFVSIPAIIGWLLAGRAVTKLIVSQHSTMSYKAYVENKHDWKVRIQPWLARLLYPLADGLHANSQEVLDDLLTKIEIKFPREKTLVTANPVNVKAIVDYSLAEAEHPWLTAKKCPVIISVGRLARQKNFPLLLRAFQIVRQSMDAKLIILGKGGERDRLQQLIQKLNLSPDVDLAGFNSNPWSLMSRADLFVLSSDEEPFGLVIVEAMACELPVVATNAIGGGPRSILADGEYGRLVPIQEPNLLAKVILEILTAENLQSHFRLASKKRSQDYQPEIVAQQWLNFLVKLNVNDRNKL